MFLFTTPTASAPAAAPAPTPAPAATPPAAAPVVDAIRQGADKTGTSFAYLLKTAQRESALDPQAKAPTSSATGLFQFIEQTWLGLMKQEGPNLGLNGLADTIVPRGDGSYGVEGADARQQILKLRENPEVSSVLAGRLTQQNRAVLADATGRDPSGGELYMAHLLGARGATNLIRMATASPERPLAPEMPEAAAANRSIFFDRRGQARGAGEVYAMLSAERPGPVADGPRSGTPVTVTGQAMPGLSGLFQTAPRTGPVSDAVAKIWRVNNTTTTATRASGESFFPRSSSAAAAPDSAPAVASGPATPVPETAAAPEPRGDASVPLPPPRPAFSGSAVSRRTAGLAGQVRP